MIVYPAKFAIIRILSCLSFQRLIAINPIRCRNQMEQHGYLQEIWLGQLTNTKISHLLNVCTMGVNGVSWWHHKWRSCKMHLSTEITCEICKNSLTWMMSSLSQETLIFFIPKHNLTWVLFTGWMTEVFSSLRGTTYVAWRVYHQQAGDLWAYHYST